MSAPLDVLAVMHSASAHLIHPDCDQMREARAAVAELVEAAKFMRDRFAKEEGLKFSQRSAVRKLDAALAKFEVRP